RRDSLQVPRTGGDRLRDELASGPLSSSLYGGRRARSAGGRPARAGGSRLSVLSRRSLLPLLDNPFVVLVGDVDDLLVQMSHLIDRPLAPAHPLPRIGIVLVR